MNKKIIALFILVLCVFLGVYGITEGFRGGGHGGHGGHGRGRGGYGRYYGGGGGWSPYYYYVYPECPYGFECIY